MQELLIAFGSIMLGVSLSSTLLKIREENLRKIIKNLVEQQKDLTDRWIVAENKAESWKRRYDNLLPETQVSFEE
jgi:adenylate kinase